MGKRKATQDGQTPSKTKMDVDDEDSDSDEDSTSLLNVDFEYFDPSPATDFPGLKTLLRQLFDTDNALLDLSALTDLILAQPLLGSTVKCEGQESDPYAFLTVLNLWEHRGKDVVRGLRKYLLERVRREKGAEGGGVKDSLPGLLLDEEGGGSQVGLILTERFVNMPHAIVPPMYSMLLEEMQWANAEGESYQFTHYLVVSKTYTEVESKLDVEDDRPQKKTKKGGRGEVAETFYFHPEDEVLQRHALASCSFEYAKQGRDGASDSKRAFQELGVKPQGCLILLKAEKFGGAVKAVGEYLGSFEA